MLNHNLSDRLDTSQTSKLHCTYINKYFESEKHLTQFASIITHLCTVLVPLNLLTTQTKFVINSQLKIFVQNKQFGHLYNSGSRIWTSLTTTRGHDNKTIKYILT